MTFEKKAVKPSPLKLLDPVPADIDIAKAAVMKPIKELADEVGILDDELELYGKYKAKVTLDILDRLKDAPDGKYIDVSTVEVYKKALN